MNAMGIGVAVIMMRSWTRFHDFDDFKNPVEGMALCLTACFMDPMKLPVGTPKDLR